MMRMTSAALITLLTVSSGTALAADRKSETVTITAVAVDNTPLLPAADVVDTSDSPREIVATRGLVLPILYASYAALQAYDGYTTIAGVEHGARETNSMMNGLAGQRAAIWAIKGGVTTVSIVVAERLWKQHRRADAIAMMVISNGLMAAIAARNTVVLRAQR